MKFRRNPRFTTSLLIFMMNIFVSRTFTCRRAEYVFGDECCPMCPIGTRVKTDCEEDKSTSCQPCREGTFMNKMNGFKLCFPCRECGAGSALKMKTSCTIRSDTVCEPLEGFYCSEFTGYDCFEAKKHRRCEPGEYISQRGTSSTDTVCSTCSDGTFSDGTFTSCQNHKQCESENRELLRAGTKTEDAQCGDIPSDRTGLIVGVVVVVHLALVLVLTAWCYRKKIKSCLNRSKNL
ncbi:tumor necrosis factor receptor superfamily member 14-like [Labrus mixtus]|uniref:tumor necrosis factor receptor superfamily member 14-like n=1 Tax=Labrus mixtus TaxID=508554 RepID=UPI0029BFD925|nr:tumor necrosis factor receptor superfamily member 14-like [Labrus mixtus]